MSTLNAARLALRLTGAALVVALAAPTAALAQSADQAEAYRLEQEIKRLADRNAWAGVERAYEDLVKLDAQVSVEIHNIGAQSARFLGKTYEVYSRLERALAIEQDEQNASDLAGIDAQYGRVRIKGDPRRRPELIRAQMPFLPDQRKSVEWAQRVVAETGSFEGMLPSGDYEIAGKAFTVAPGAEWQDVNVSRKEATAAGARGEGIIYKGPVAVLGYSFAASGEPSEAKPAADVASPTSISGSGLHLEGGYEIGLTRQFGVAPVVGYRGMYSGGHTFHHFTAWAAFAFRPGDLRLAAGPAYGVIQGSGTGVAEWFDANHDRVANPSDSIGYQGVAAGPGLKFSAGYGLLDFDPLQGVVELGGIVQTDGARTYMGFGLHIGIVPKIPRFEG
ncbi:MAG: hypothetical protein EP330_02225 [Deltaproteobacteria bacterium]|nr:MAG: hypothetical protein EP330_02225 [Deltaproteobacteria bacterium]